MNIPKQPLNQRIFKYSLTSLIVVSAIWSASGLEITLDRISPIIVLILVAVIAIEQFSVWLRRKIL